MTACRPTRKIVASMVVLGNLNEGWRVSVERCKAYGEVYDKRNSLKARLSRVSTIAESVMARKHSVGEIRDQKSFISDYRHLESSPAVDEPIQYRTQDDGAKNRASVVHVVLRDGKHLGKRHPHSHIYEKA